MEKGVNNSYSCFEQSAEKWTLEKSKSKLRAMTKAAMAFLLTSCASNISKNDIPDNFTIENSPQKVEYTQHQVQQQVEEVLTYKNNNEIATGAQHSYTLKYDYDVYGQSEYGQVDTAAWLGKFRETSYGEYEISINSYSVDMMVEHYDIPQNYAEQVIYNNEYGSGEHYVILNDLKIWDHTMNPIDYKNIGEFAGDVYVFEQILSGVDSINPNDSVAIQEKIQELRAGILFYYSLMADESAQSTSEYQLSIDLMNKNFSEVFGASMSASNLKNMLDHIGYISLEDQYATIQQFSDFYKGLKGDFNLALQTVLYAQEIEKYNDLKNAENYFVEKSYSNDQLYAKNH